MSCHNCMHENPDACSSQDRHIPGDEAACANCIRNPLKTHSSLLEIPTDNYVDVDEFTELVSKRFTVRNNREIWLGNRCVGWIFTTAGGGKILRTTRNRKKHYMRIYEAWALSKAVLLFLKASGFQFVQIQIGKTEFLDSPLQDWFDHGIERQFAGYELQVFLPERYMTRHKQRLWDLAK